MKRDTPKKSITATQVLGLLERQNYICAISGRQLTPETASLDHIVPLSRGGEHSIDNVWIVDHAVNIAKGTLSLNEFVSLCREVVAWQKSAADARRPSDRLVPSPEPLFESEAGTVALNV